MDDARRVLRLIFERRRADAVQITDILTAIDAGETPAVHQKRAVSRAWPHRVEVRA